MQEENLVFVMLLQKKHPDFLCIEQVWHSFLLGAYINQYDHNIYANAKQIGYQRVVQTPTCKFVVIEFNIELIAILSITLQALW